MTARYRPHGPLRWLLDRMPNGVNWDVIGALSAEQRSTTVPVELATFGKLGRCSLIRVHDLPTPFAVPAQQAMADRENELRAQLPRPVDVRDADLMSDIPELTELAAYVDGRIGGKVVLDISCLPKRFFFYLVRHLLQSATVTDLLVTVTIPQKYGRELSRNAGHWAFLPSFGRVRSDRASPVLIIGVGYQHLNILQVAEEVDRPQVRLLFPFPSKPPGGIRNWEFVRNVEHKFTLKHGDIIRVHPQATSLAFDILIGQCQQADEVWLAPFGPKSISLAMVLFALAREARGEAVSIGYTQPPAYSPDYSTGVERDVSGSPLVHAYCIKLGGRAFYTY